MDNSDSCTTSLNDERKNREMYLQNFPKIQAPHTSQALPSKRDKFPVQKPLKRQQRNLSSSYEGTKKKCTKDVKQKLEETELKFYLCHYCLLRIKSLDTLKSHLENTHSANLDESCSDSDDENDISEDGECTNSSRSTSSDDDNLMNACHKDDDEIWGYGIENEDAIKSALEDADRYIAIEQEDYGNLKVYTHSVRNVKQLIQEAKAIMEEQRHVFRINIQIGVILKDISTQEYSLWYAASNTSIFERALLIKKRTQMGKVVKEIQNYFDSENYFKSPKSGIVPVRLAYARFMIAKDSRPLGACNCCYSDIPAYLKENRYIVTSVRDYRNQQQCDNLCMFRAASEHLFRNKIKTFGKTKGEILRSLFSKFLQKRGNMEIKPRDFEGMEQCDIPILEKICAARINIYILEKLDKESEDYPKGLRAIPAYLSENFNDEPANGTCNMSRWNQHVFYIINLYQCLGFLTCGICDYRIAHSQNFFRHVKMCSNRLNTTGNAPKEVFHSCELYKPPLEILEEIEQKCNMKFDSQVKDIHYLSVWDVETYFNTFNEVKTRGKNTRTLSTLNVFVIGCASNIQSFEDAKMFWITECGTDFGKAFLEHLIEMSHKQRNLLKRQLHPVYGALEQKRQHAKDSINKYGVKMFDGLIERLNNFVDRMPCLGYNSGKFDAKVTREFLLPALLEKYGTQNISTTLKDGRYMKISSPEILFLDQLNYLPAGKMTYEQWVYTTLGKRLKQKLCYSFIDSLEKLDYQSLPELSEWHSDLKGHNVLESDYLSYQGYLEQGLDSDTALANLGLQEIPKNGQETLHELRIFFQKQSFKTLKDYIAWYLEADLLPFVKSAEKQSRTFFQHYDINLYRSYPSIPAVGIKFAFSFLEDSDVFIPSEESYKLLKEKTVGGQSILVQLEALSNITKIRQSEFGAEARTCQSVFSLDASLMYGFAMNTMVVNYERIRRACNDFIPEFPDERYRHYKNAERILTFVKWDRKLKKMESFLRGGERKCTTTPQHFQPDAVAENWQDGKYIGQVVIEVYGDKAHCCTIHKHEPDELHHTRRRKDGKKMTYAEVEEADTKRIKALTWEFDDAEIMIVQMCEFDRDYTSSSGIYHNKYLQFLTAFPQYNSNRQKLTEKQLLHEIQAERIHGFVLADFEAGAELRQRTENFPIFFKKTYVGRADCGALMQTYLEKANLLKKPRLELITSHFGKELLVSTKLCKFYLDIGAQVTNVQKVIEYDITAALKNMVDMASELRWRASNKEEQTLGNLMKSLVVSSYGKMLTNPLHFTSTNYVTDRGLVKALHKGNFINVDYVGQMSDCEKVYEIRKHPSVAHYKSPYHMGAWILNAAKCHILNLVYKVIEPCMDPRSWTVFCSQTDSLSVVCSEKNFEDWIQNCLLPEKRDVFEKLRKEYFVLPGNSEEARRSKYCQGVYKIEWIVSGGGAIGLSAKVYAAFNDCDKIVKMSCRSVPFIAAKNLTFQQFYSVLHEHKPISVSYQSFNYVLGQMYCEQMTKSAITPFYIKRIVMPDMSTRTLDL